MIKTVPYACSGVLNFRLFVFIKCASTTFLHDSSVIRHPWAVGEFSSFIRSSIYQDFLVSFSVPWYFSWRQLIVKWINLIEFFRFLSSLNWRTENITHVEHSSPFLFVAIVASRNPQKRKSRWTKNVTQFEIKKFQLNSQMNQTKPICLTLRNFSFLFISFHAESIMNTQHRTHKTKIHFLCINFCERFFKIHLRWGFLNWFSVLNIK